MSRGKRWQPRVFFRWAAVALVIAVPWMTLDSQATIAIYMKLNDGAIKGEVNTSNHKGEIELLSMGFGTSSSASFQSGGKANVQDLTIAKYVDTSTTELFKRLLTGNQLDEATIGFYETINDTEHRLLSLKLEDILVTAHKIGSTDGTERLTEDFSLNFAKFTFETFKVINNTSQSNGSITWDIPSNSGGSTGPTNAPPTISSITAQTVAEDSSITVPFTISDDQTATGALTLSRSTDNPLVIPISGITFGGSGSNRTVIITPTPNASGTTTVAVTVTDSAGLTASRSFTVTVTPVNDPPVIQPVAAQITNRNTSFTVPLNITDVDTASTSLTVSGTSGNTSVVASSGITFTGNGASTVMTITPQPDATGTTTVTLIASDGQAFSNGVSFTVTVNAFVADIQWTGAAPVIPENSANDTVAGTLSVTGSNLTLSLLDSAGGRFKLGGAGNSSVLVANGSLLDFETSSSHNITARVTDAVQNTFDKQLVITLSNVNEAPIITTSIVPPVPVGGSGTVGGITIGDPDAGAANVGVSFSVNSGKLTLATTGSLAGKVTENNSALVSAMATLAQLNSALSAGALTYTATGVSAGTHPLTIHVNDQGNSGSGGAKFTIVTTDITVLDTAYSAWQKLYFSTEEIANPLVSGPKGDPDQDGIPNLLEYGVGTHPRNSAEGPGAVEIIRHNTDGVDYPAVRFKRLKPTEDPKLLIEVEVATDNFNWRTDAGDTVVAESTQFDSRRNQMVIRSSQPISATNRQMMRLRFTLVP